jgi:hypothetical protein
MKLLVRSVLAKCAQSELKRDAIAPVHKQRQQFCSKINKQRESVRMEGRMLEMEGRKGRQQRESVRMEGRMLEMEGRKGRQQGESVRMEGRMLEMEGRKGRHFHCKSTVYAPALKYPSSATKSLQRQRLARSDESAVGETGATCMFGVLYTPTTASLCDIL